MSLLSGWVLSHKRIVAVCWVLLTIAGVAAVGPASKALKSDSSLPNKEGWATNAAIAALYSTDRGGSAPLVSVVTFAGAFLEATTGIEPV